MLKSFSQGILGCKTGKDYQKCIITVHTWRWLTFVDLYVAVVARITRLALAAIIINHVNAGPYRKKQNIESGLKVICNLCKH